MNLNRFKIIVILLLAAIVVTFTHCGKPFGPPSELIFQSNVYGGGSEVSYNAFERTVYPLTRSYCINCHSSIQPLHAADDVNTAHDAVVSQFKVNFSNIRASRLVAKLRDEQHNCWKDCAESAREMEAAITRWNEAIKASGINTTPVDTAIYTEETSPMEIEFMDSTNPLKSNSIRLNIEAAMLKAPMELIKPAGTEAYLSVPTTLNTTLLNNDPDAGIAYFNFTVPANGQYRVWGLVHGPSATDDSFFVNIINKTTNASVSGGVRLWEFTNARTRFEWRQLPNVAPSLAAGTNYTLELKQREDGARLAGLIITADSDFNGQEVGDYFGITLVFDLSTVLRIPDVRFMIDVIDYDPYSYKFSKPRIVTSAQGIYAKGLKLYVNGIFSPQHSTYTIIDKLVTPTDSSLSGYSMIVLKDKGPSGDHIKFSFDQLSAAGMETTSGSTSGGGIGGTSPQTSLMAFQSSVYPISRSSAYSCVGCHRQGPAPASTLHASDNAATAHDAALALVDFNNPSNSRIVNKMRGNHNCGANCDNLANLYQAAITEWRTKRQ